MKQHTADIAPKIAPVIKREALPEQIVRQLVGLMKAGYLKPGDRLPAERTLAEELGVGRPTLREALRALQLLGVLDIRHGGGVFVAQREPDALPGPLRLFIDLDDHRLRTILEARKGIEGALLAFVAPRIDEHAIHRLEANLAQFAEAIRTPRGERPAAAQVAALAEEFRAIIESAAGNPILTRAVENLSHLSAATRQRLTTAAQLAPVLGSHRRIVEALRRHDPAAAQAAMEAHIDYLGEVCGVAPPATVHA